MSQSGFDGFISSALRMAKIIGVRVLLHITALALASQYFVSMGSTPLEATYCLSIYAGIICLLPYGSVKNPYWWVPVAAGAVEGLALVLCGMPWVFGVFGAGLLTWTLRLVIAKGKIGWDWTAVPVLLLSLWALVETFMRMALPLWPLSTFLVALIAGYKSYITCSKVLHANIHRQMLAASLVRLRAVVESKALGQQVGTQSRLLLSLSESLALCKDCPDILIDRIVNVTGELEDLSKSLAARPAWSKALFKSTQWQHLAADNVSIQGGRMTTEDVVNDILQLNKDITATLAELRGETQEEPEAAQKEEMTLNALALSVSDLTAKKPSLPQEFGAPLEAIATHALGMVQSMREDPNDRAAGMSFLSRYLPRAHNIVDQFIAMSPGLTPEVRQTTSARLLQTLNQFAITFKEKKEKMSRNDVSNLMADLDTLDTMLKMQRSK